MTTDTDMIVVGDIKKDTRKPSLVTNKCLDDITQAVLESMVYDLQEKKYQERNQVNRV